MRIRKRFPPSSSISSAALSDPQLHRSPVVQVQPHVQVNLSPHENLHVVQEEAKDNNPRNPDPPNQPFQQPRSQVIMIRNENPRWGFLNNGTDEEKLKQKEIEGKEIKDERCSSNDTRKENIFQEELVATQFPQPSSSSSSSPEVVSERWCEGDKVVPLKKRKGSFETIVESKGTVLKAKMKSKTNKKCLQQNGEGQEGLKNTTSSGAKKIKRGNVIMEGSRCSRVNGRGWRCSQQTLVGYSLCEHHLGKGRLRSMTSVRNRAVANQIGVNEKDEIIAPVSGLLEKEEMKSFSLSSKNDHDVDEDDDNDEEKPLVVVTKKRMKLGAVKARSMSSLLGQTNNVAVAASNGSKYSG